MVSTRQTAMTAAVIALIASVASGNIRAYAIDPVRADWSGKADPRPDYGVSQFLTINFDEPITASLFCGAVGNGGRYHVSILTCPGGHEIASGDTVCPGDHRWAVCTLLVSRPDSFIKGRRIEVRWTRSGSDFWA